MILSNKFNEKSFAVYGLGKTGKSVINFLKKSGVSRYLVWDDNVKKRREFNIKKNIKFFSDFLDFADYIVTSPGINLKKSVLVKKFKKNQRKIITDIDLLYMTKNVPKTIVITGTNGKSTTCKILEYLLQKNKIKVKLGGNIGNPILDLKNLSSSICIIEASSFQLAHSKYIKPKYATILNLSKDHLDWHGNVENYINSKFKAFNLQDKHCLVFLSAKSLIYRYKKKKYLGKLKTYNIKSYLRIKNRIKNDYLNLKVNDQNLSFVYEISKFLKIKKKNFISSLTNFKGLQHRHETFIKLKNINFINDSKATSFEASKHAIENNKNIFWIVGGLPKLGDKFNLEKIKKNINTSFIIGTNPAFFKKQLKSNKLTFKVTKNLKNTIRIIFKEILKNPEKKITVLLSPASASYDQYKNFMERGNEFKQLVKLYARRYI